MGGGVQVYRIYKGEWAGTLASFSSLRPDITTIKRFGIGSPVFRLKNLKVKMYVSDLNFWCLEKEDRHIQCSREVNPGYMCGNVHYIVL